MNKMNKFVAKKFINTLFSSSIVKNLSILVSGTAIAQLLVIGFQLILRRIFTPSDFGAFAVYMSVLGIVATLSSMRYEQAIVLPEQPRAGVGLLKIAISLAIITSAILGFFILVFKNQLADWLNFPKPYLNWLYILPFSIALFSIYQALNLFLIRTKKFKRSASNKIIRRLSEGTTQFTFGKLGMASGLFIGDMVGQLAMIITTWFSIKKDIQKEPKIPIKEMFRYAINYRDFPLKSAIPSLLNAFSLLLPVLIINRLFDEQVTGFFDLSRVVLIVPLSLITASLSQIVLQQFTEKRNNHLSIKKDSLAIFAGLVGFALLFVVVIAGWGPDLFSFFFGNQWLSSGIYAQWLVWAFAIKFVVSPFNMVYTAFEKLGLGAIWQTSYFLLIVALYFIPFSGIHQFLKGYVGIELLAYSFSALLNFSILASYEQSLKLEAK